MGPFADADELDRVRCLECGTSYTKPAEGGTVQREPGLSALRLPRLGQGDTAAGRRTAPLRRGSAAACRRPTALTPPK